ncbi:MAG: CoA transferase, partial [Chloroflexi bacterium]|nr:CoA transferase [Chloroflexota bacterium]
GVADGKFTRALVDWMQESAAYNEVAGVSWEDINLVDLDQIQIDVWERAIAGFFLSKTKAALVDAAGQRGFLLYPVNTAADVVNEPQVVQRGFLQKIPGDASALSYPGALWRSTATATRPNRPPPTLGQDNIAIYCGELGLTRSELSILAAEGAI